MKSINQEEFERRAHKLFDKVNEVLKGEEFEIVVSTIFSMTGAFIDRAKGKNKIALQELLLCVVKNLHKK